MQPEYSVIVIGGGFFGCSLALYLKNYADRILILEKENRLLQRASYANQARVHNGYHYPRSILTALRSRANFSRFAEQYRDCIQDGVEQYYAVCRNSSMSKITAAQFRKFCQRVGAPVESAPREIVNLFKSDMIEAAFLVKECAFDATKLTEKITQDLADKEIEVRLNSKAVRIRPVDDSEIGVYFGTGSQGDYATARFVFNCTYSQLNQVLTAADLGTVPLKHELAEIALIEVPDHLRNIAVTIIDGPFFSTMPFPPRSLHSLTHVRYTPHCSWVDTGVGYTEPHEVFKNAPRKTNYPYMIRDAQRYIPSMESCQYVDSLWEIKTVLPQSEVDDSRPILFLRSQELKNFVSVMGGKLDNIYDVFHEVECLFDEGEGVH